jgi:hypothetical protein
MLYLCCVYHSLFEIFLHSNFLFLLANNFCVLLDGKLNSQIWRFFSILFLLLHNLRIHSEEVCAGI